MASAAISKSPMKRNLISEEQQQQQMIPTQNNDSHDDNNSVKSLSSSSSSSESPEQSFSSSSSSSPSMNGFTLPFGGSTDRSPKKRKASENGDNHHHHHQQEQLQQHSSEKVAKMPDPEGMTDKHRLFFDGFGTRAIHAGQEPERWNMNQVVPSISISTTYKQNEPGKPKGYDYGRAGNPTRDVLEENLAALEDAKFCRVFSSGLSAAMALSHLLKVGDHILSSDDVYGGTQRYFRKVSVEKHGLEFNMIDMTKLENVKQALKPNTKMVWFESPSNPLLKIVDIEAVVQIVKAFNKDIIIVVDNTFMSPYFQKPLALGADVVMHSLTKYINGHSDVLMGSVMTNINEIDEHLYFSQLAVGAVPSAFDSYLVIRGIKTLHLRMRTHMENALAVAKWLETNFRVEKVLYPELESHPQHKIHKKQSRGMSGMISFYLRGGLEESKTFLSSLKVFILAESLGGYESLAELPSIMTHASVPEKERRILKITDNLIRLSVGCEEKDDLIADLDQALRLAIPNKN